MEVTLVTHAGTFHADDVFSTAFLKMYIRHIGGSIIDIRRVNTINEIDIDNSNDDAIIYDIGYGDFDHHQENSPVRENGIPYAAFGLLWRKFAPSMFDGGFVEEFDKSFVSVIDSQDNGIAANPLSLTVSAMNPTWDSDKDPDDCFLSAVGFAEETLKLHFDRYFSRKRAEISVQNAVRNMRNGILVFDKFVPFEAFVINNAPDVKFAVFPSNREGWTLKTIRKASDTFEPRVSLPETWLTRDIPNGLLFCHKALFMATFDTKENAIAAAWSLVKPSPKIR